MSGSNRYSSVLRTAIAAGALALLSACGTLSLSGGQPALEWVAGSLGSGGNLDGRGVQARFGGAALSVRADRDGGLLVIDTDGSTVRHIDARGNVTTLAGKTGYAGYQDGPATHARLAKPSDAVRGPDGIIYVADTGNDVIRTIRPDGSVATLAGTPGTSGDEDGPLGVGQLSDPQKLALDRHGRLWVAQRRGVRVIDADGSITTWQPVDDALFSQVSAITTAPDGEIWAAIVPSPYSQTGGDATYTVGRLTQTGYIPLQQPAKPVEPTETNESASEDQETFDMSQAQPGPVAELIGRVPFIGRAPLPPEVRAESEPDADAAEDANTRYVDLAFDASGTLYAAREGRIDTLGSGGELVSNVLRIKVARYDEGLQSMAIDANGRLFVTTRGKESVQRVDTDGGVSSHAGLGRGDALPSAKASSSVYQPLPGLADSDVVQAADGTVYFADSRHHAIYRTRRDGKTELWAGAREEGHVDGEHGAARFLYPSGLALDAAGNLYVADTGNSAIRRIDAQGHVTTVVGRKPDDGEVRVDGDFAQATFWWPSHLRFDSQGRLYVLDEYAGRAYSDETDEDLGARIRRIDLQARTVSTVAREIEQAKQQSPEDIERLIRDGGHGFTYTDLSIGPAGQLYVLTKNGTVWRIDTETGQHHIYFLPKRLAVEQAFEQTYSEMESARERERLLDGKLKYCEWVWCSQERLAADIAGNLYVSDRRSHTIVRITPDRKAGVIAGQPGLRGNRPGPLPGTLNQPSALSIAANGDLLALVGGEGIMRVRSPALAPAQPPAIEDGANAKSESVGVVD